jgi:hypothetical protein
MKKSKILIPAIAVLALSAGAATTGTLAWFTASRTATITANNIMAVNTSGNLTAEVTPDGASTTAGTGTNSIDFKKLRDASYNVESKLISQAEFDMNNNVTGYSAVTNNLYGTIDENSIYYTAQFSVKFSIPTGNVEDTYALVFDARSDSSNLSGTDAIRPGFRVAMYTLDDESAVKDYTVWAPEYTGALDGSNGPSYVASDGTYGGETEPALGKYTNDHAIKSADTYYTDSSDFNIVKSDVATLSSDLNPTEEGVTVYFVAWFEGTDGVVINDNAMNDATTALTATMQFYTVKD